MIINDNNTNNKPKKKLELMKGSNGKATSSTKLVIFDDIDKEKVLKYYRYYPLIIITSCGKR